MSLRPHLAFLFNVEMVKRQIPAEIEIKSDNRASHEQWVQNPEKGILLESSFSGSA